MSVDTVPKDLRNLRACLVCSLIKVTLNLVHHVLMDFIYVCVQTFEQFEYDGCENCEEFLRMKSNKDNIYDCTSSNFDG